ncbi:3-dehydroquinate synthase [Corynebacterium pilosum]|uniref:3-dehydroquinate synthase n=1 Tax=Corynebacterium pilosum TaxID=35756 RepID=A0A376CQI9_9CORY|nr:3-dehydroquinate synthase [Corynebacterium pilosum]STC70542.1 3-dehydroquinate synthase [Corynebacterium pilosum]
MATITVSGPTPYDVYIDRNLTNAVSACVKDIGAHKVAIVHQPALAAPARSLAEEIRASNIEAVLAPIPDAEDGKTLEVAGGLWDLLGEHNFSRQDAVIGLGGGATTDLAGFVAAAWMRGIKVLQVPTTLLAMVDAAVGGKTGINTAAGKNLVGAFHEPSGVYIDLDRLYTLDDEEIVAGSAEIIKTGFIADERILEIFEADPQRALDVDGDLPELIERSVAVKGRVVGQDLKESGLREMLNYGHTFGHAVEKREQYRWRHGHAVAVGMMFVAHLAHERGLIDDNLLRRHKTILESVGLPTTYEAGAFDELLEGMSHDKKNRDGMIRFVALDGVGSVTRIEGPSVEELRAAYDAISE